MKVLAIDSATSLLSVSLTQSGEEPALNYQTVRDVGLFHSQSVMSIVAETLAAAAIDIADVDLVACARGPGSFTGLRIGMATAKGLAAAIAEKRNLSTPPLVSVRTLDALSAPHSALGMVVLPVIDARKKRFYGAFYQNGRDLTEQFDLSPTDIVKIAEEQDLSSGLMLTGPDAQLFAGIVPDLKCVIDRDCRRGWAKWIGDIAVGLLAQSGYDAADQGPNYLRGSEAEIARRRKSSKE